MASVLGRVCSDGCGPEVEGTSGWMEVQDLVGLLWDGPFTAGPQAKSMVESTSSIPSSVSIVESIC